jgi:predicted transcriptional regulator of viral defense system
MKISKAITLTIGELEQPVVTSYQLGVILFNLYKVKSYKGEAIASLQKLYPDSGTYNRKINQLQEEGILTSYKGFPDKSVFSLLGRSHDSVEDIVCTVDPFCYVSHLSAMEYHGLTNRVPSKLFISSPAPKLWKGYARAKMEKDLKGDLGIYNQNNMPELKRTRFEKIDRREIHRFSSVHWGAYKNIKGRMMRVSTIGRTFLDMLKNPELCGGINHVLEVFEEHAESYQQLIIDEVGQHGGPIDKVRAGYILDERLKLEFNEKKDWLKSVQRGGSRKLDASSEYEPVWSEKWCLSLNVIDNVKG